MASELMVRARNVLLASLFGGAYATALWTLASTSGSQGLGVLPATSLAMFAATLIAFAGIGKRLFRLPALSIRGLARALLAGILLAAATALLIMAARMGAAYLACLAFTAAGVTLAPVFRRLARGGFISMSQRCGTLMGIAAMLPWIISNPAAHGLLALSTLLQSSALSSWTPVDASNAPRQTYWFWALLGGGALTSVTTIVLQAALGANEMTSMVRPTILAGQELRALVSILCVGAFLALRVTALSETSISLGGGRVACLWVFTLIVFGTTFAGLARMGATPATFATLPVLFISVMLTRTSLQGGMTFRGLVGLTPAPKAASAERA